MRRDLAGVEDAHLLREVEGTVLRHALQARVRGVGHRLRELRVAGLEHDRQRRRAGEVQQFRLLRTDVAHLLEVVEDVAVGLEGPAEVRQFGPHRVAGLAGHAGLAGKARDRLGGLEWQQGHAQQQHRQPPARSLLKLPFRFVLHRLLPCRTGRPVARWGTLDKLNTRHNPDDYLSDPGTCRARPSVRCRTKATGKPLPRLEQGGPDAGIGMVGTDFPDQLNSCR